MRDRWLLSAGEVHVWRTSLERPAATVTALHGLLSADERARAARFRFDRDCNRYVVGRGVLRTLLGCYLDAGAHEVEFEYGPFDKPRLATGDLHFNLSHSGPVALYAFARGGEVGIDVELDDADFARERIAERFFSPREVAVLRSLPLGQQARAFLVCWTRKEAFIKARGDGLSLPLDSFDVSLAPGEPAALLRAAWSVHEPARWQLEDLSDRGSGYIAALALQGRDWRVLKREIPDNIEGIVPEQEDQ